MNALDLEALRRSRGIDLTGRPLLTFSPLFDNHRDREPRGATKEVSA